MTVDVMRMDPSATLASAVAKMRGHCVRHLCVVEATGRLVGILSTRDVSRAMPSVFAEGKDGEYDRVLETARVRHVMTSTPIVIGPDAPLGAAADQMTELNIGALPVIESGSGRLLGIMTQADCRMAVAQLSAPGEALAA